MMASVSETAPAVRDSNLEVLVHQLRQQLADFLQSVYSAVALLHKRLPPERDLERRVMSNLQIQAELYKHLLDNIDEFLSPPSSRTFADTRRDLPEQPYARGTHF